MRKTLLTIAVALTSHASIASAHVDVVGPAFAGQHQILSFMVGHGCEGADTYRLEIKIPSEITSLRPLPNAFGEAQITTDQAGLITAVAWEKSAVRAADDHFYEMRINVRVPNVPFTRLYFPLIQSCRTEAGVESVVEWNETAGEHPAATLLVLPPRAPGWNRYQVQKAITDLSMFNDAQIVWVGEAAYSANEAVMEVIEADPDVAELTSIPANATVWVKY